MVGRFDRMHVAEVRLAHEHTNVSHSDARAMKMNRGDAIRGYVMGGDCETH
jgi:hypothetical protein